MSERQVGRRLDAHVSQLVIDAAAKEKSQSVLMRPLLERPQDEGAVKNIPREMDVTTEHLISGD